MGENDVYFRSYTKKITYERYTPLTANTVVFELANVYVETEIKVQKIIDIYQAARLLDSISKDIWGEDRELRGCFRMLLT